MKSIPENLAHPAVSTMTWGVRSDVGRHREENEDAFMIESQAGLFLVSDGMGGHRGGKLASQTVVHDLAPAIESKLSSLSGRRPRAIRNFLRRRLAEQNRQLRMEGDSESGHRGMGATVVLLLVVDDRAYVANLGDSRMYRFRRNRLLQLSRDHSAVAELLEEGRITEQEAEAHEDVGVITHYMGMDEPAKPHVRSFALCPGDRILLCSDGLTDMVSESSLKSVLREESHCQDCCDRLIALANEAGGWDNITALLVEWQG